jgi:PTS system galactitol-specific IIA component
MEGINLKKEFVLINHESKTFEQTIHDICQPLIQDQAIKNEYFDAVIKRESEWPTGLPTEPFGVAIPHADGENLVLKPSLAIAILKEPIDVDEAGSEADRKVKAQIIFLIAMKSVEGQLNILKKLNLIFLQKDYLEKIRYSKSSQEVIDILRNIE